MRRGSCGGWFYVCFCNGNYCNCQRNDLFIDQRIVKVGRHPYRSSGAAPSQLISYFRLFRTFPLSSEYFKRWITGQPVTIFCRPHSKPEVFKWSLLYFSVVALSFHWVTLRRVYFSVLGREKGLGLTKSELQEGAEESSSSLTHPCCLFTALIPFHSTLGLGLLAVTDMQNSSNYLKCFFPDSSRF